MTPTSDSGTDASFDSGTDASFDDSGTDASTDSGTDAEMDSGTDSGVDSGSDAGSDAGVDSGTDAGTDAAVDSGTDAATGPVCGDGLIEAPELCDGDCPTACDDSDVCTNDELVGSAASCSAECAFTAISACMDADGCCAPGCDFTNDDDCPAPPAVILVNEVLYDAVGADAAGAFIELYGAPGTPLAGYDVVGVNGATGADYMTIPLAGTMPASGLFVIAHPSAAEPLHSQADLLDTHADLQNGPDSVQVRFAGGVVDALGYGDFSAASFAGEGSPVARGVAGESASRDAAHSDTDDNLTDFSVGAPSPGADEACAMATPPRLIYPLAAARVTNGDVPFRWELPAEDTGAQLELCDDASCASIVTTIDAMGSTILPATTLAAGHYFWRARGTCGAVTSASTSPTWEFTVAQGTRAAHASWTYTFDANGDGYADALIAEGFFPSPAVHYYTGNGSGLLEVSGFGVTGTRVELAGDVNGDGYGDALIGNYLHLGSASGLSSTPAANLGTVEEVVGLGDVDGDGYADIGAIRRTPGSSLRIYRGGATFSTTPAQNFMVDPGTNATVDIAGDVNADGYADVLVTNCRSTGSACDGDVFVYLGGPAGVDSTPAWSLLTTTRLSVSGGGDINGDGYSDVIVSDWWSVSVYYGGPAGPSTTADRTIAAPTTDYGFGQGLAIIGDRDADGYDDILVGNPTIDTVWSYRGPSLSADGSVARVEHHDLGEIIQAAGDITGDGFDESLAGAPSAAAPATWDYVYMFRGRAFPISATTGGSQYITGSTRNRRFGSSLR